MQKQLIDLVFATNNQHKLEEARSILGTEANILSLKDIGCFDELPETGDTLEFNAHQKARYVFEKYGHSCFADDTGLEVDGLGGEPGVYSARYAGLQANSDANMDRLLREMASLTDRRARFRTVISLILPEVSMRFDGVITGSIAYEKKGTGGFGYDPLFIPTGQERSFAEWSPEEKNALSHRGVAIRRMADWLAQHVK